jgi:benzoate 4-monooxygenase
MWLHAYTLLYNSVLFAGGYYIYSYLSSRLRHIPGPWYSFLTGLYQLHYASQGRLYLVKEKLFEQYGDIVRLGPTEVTIRDPAAVSLLLRENDFAKPDVYTLFTLADGKPSSFSMVDREEHRKRRRLTIQAFSTKALKASESIMFSVGVEQMAKFIDRNEGKPIDIGLLFHRGTLNVICKTAFGASIDLFKEGLKPSDEAEKVKDAIASVQNIIVLSLTPFLKRCTFLPFVKENFEKQKFINEYATSLRVERLRELKTLADKGEQHSYNDILQYLIDCEDPETGEKLSDDEVTAESVTFLVAGSETSSNTMTWAIYFLLKHPQYFAELRGEIDRVSPKPGFVTHLTIRDEMPYLNAVLEETLRFMPVAAAGTSRVLDKDSQLCGHFLPKGTEVNIAFYSLHRNHKVWEKADQFIPDRFLNTPLSSCKDKHVTFSAGIRGCVGKDFAKMEMRVFLVNLLKDFDIKLVNPTLEVTGKEGLTLNTSEPVSVYITRRR